MELHYLTIGFADIDIHNIEMCFSQAYSKEAFIAFKTLYNVDIEFNNYYEEYKYADDFLKQNNLKDENEFFNEFDIQQYATQMEFIAKAKFKNLEILEFAVFSIAQHLSKTLNVKCILLYKDTHMPIALFDSGNIIEQFEKYNTEFFSTKLWLPNKAYLEKTS